MQTTATKPSFQLRRLLPESDGAPWLRVVPEDGWLTLVLLATVVYTTIASIQGADWAPDTDILTPMTFAGLVLGYLAVQQGRLPRSLIHILAIALGIAFAFKETADATLGGDWRGLLGHTRIWFKQTIIDQQSSSDNQVFLLFLAILSFLLAYISVWLVVHTRRPWLAALANGVVLLINLNWASSDKTVLFTVIFLLATLLLLVRFTLAENMRQWRARGLRFSPDLGWDFMQAGAIFAVIVLLLGFMLPASQANQAILDAWNSPTNPWNGVQDAFGKLFAGISGTGVGNGPGGQGFFGADLKLRGSVNLPTNVILRYKLPNAGDDPSQYLITETFDTYNGNNTWTSTPTQTVSFQPSESLPTSNPAVPLKTNSYQIIYSVIPSGTHVFAPGTEAQSFDISTQTFISSASQTPVQWLAAAPLSTGKPYISTAYISTATADQLRKVPYPANVAPADQATAYPPGLLAEYLFSTRQSTIPADVRQQAQDATRGTTNMYDAATSIESYLRTFTYSLTNPDPPADQDAISWFLQEKRGFCTFFASAMAIMGRSLGMPTRIALGFSHGEFDPATNSWIVRGTQAHVWTQIYFAGYGWIDFEPTSSFDIFARAVTASGGPTTPVVTPGASGTPNPKDTNPDDPSHRISPNAGGGGSNPASTALVETGLALSLLIVLALLGVALFTLWWRLLYRGFTPVGAAFARVSRLGAWAGAPPTRADTPDEYAEKLSDVIPGQQPALRRLSDLYARERWGGGLHGDSAEELPRVYEQVRRSITPVIIQRARHLPLVVLRFGRRTLRRPHTHTRRRGRTAP